LVKPSFSGDLHRCKALFFYATTKAPSYSNQTLLERLDPELLQHKAEVIRLEARYVKLHDRKQPVRHAVEMARLAEKLGRTFEARALLALAVAENPDQADLQQAPERLIRSRSPGAPPADTLAQAVANELASHATTGDRSATP
jgi:hypothetical protein